MTIMGTIGCFIPFASKEDHEFFSLLELNLRQQGKLLFKIFLRNFFNW